MTAHPIRPTARAATTPGAPSAWLRWLALLALSAPYLQGGLVKAADFGAAIAEMQHFGLAPAAPLAAAVIVLELGAAALMLSGRLRWLGALALAVFTLLATFVANRFWQAPPDARFGQANAFFEHIALAGGLCLVAWEDLRQRRAGRGQA
ncbi:putative membrane protein YphA, DoxX/SURF4 family [Cupriavidus necator]|uniref:DoxX family protein n=1 Tax=Cupriavidus necator (strain ATCC 17699 / DSM 428 / KCTC 22496 / NCIMB 10442 / H16 / Stanier 337) TaxID=381666 RepID=Q0JZV1_CUPNH|nr:MULTISPECIES: DoxX family protein [Cupriavidus]EON18060.1 hypothetical protein C265_19899 [Cupriavidus sp. GA3-3]QQB79234.1 DoxX family protein [Cupriavidus necator]WKA43456.1 DoxX family protein [Cupriavidus necator]CAJ96723.1 Hypothetical protein H16_B1941 [Cupriavidus necator H16]